MKISGKIKLLLCTLSLTVILPTITAFANSGVYSVKPVLTESQKSDIENYVSIKVDVELNREFEYKITNRSNEELKLKVTALNALTSSNGVIQYIEETEEDNSIITDEDYLFTKYVEKIEDVVIPKLESKVIKVKVKMPKIDGQVLGGIGFSAITEGETSTEGESQFTINNELKTVVGFLVDFGTETTVNIKVGEPFVNPMPSYYALRLPLEFDSSNIVDGPTITYKVTDSKGKEMFNSEGEKPLNFAPKSKTNYVIPWDNSKITKGENYTLTGSISYIHKDKRETKEFTKEFTLTGEESEYGQSLIEPTVADEGKSDMSKMVLLISILSISILFIVFLVIRKVKYSKQESNQYEMIMFSNSPNCPEVITEDDTEYLSKLETIEDAVNSNKLKFGIIYTSSKDSSTGRNVFKLDRIINL